LSSYEPPVASQVYSADGTLIGEFYFEKRYLVPLEEIPVVVRRAFLAAEDATFYEHHGVDAMSIVRAFLNNLIAGEVTQGGSTITQQVVKSLLLTPQKSYERKVKEIILARRLEQQLTKDQILSLYLNQIYLGAGAYGVAAAAQEYFGKKVGELTLAEASLLAGLPQAPSRYSPLRHPERAKARRQYVLRRMQKEGFITREERDQAEAEPVVITPSRGPAWRQAPDYVEYVRRTLEMRYGNRAPYQLGLRIFTAVDLRLQAAAEQAVRSGLKELDRRRGYRAPLRRLTEAEAEPFLEAQEEMLGERALEEGKSVEALVVKASKDRAVVRIGARTAVLPASRMEWAGKPDRFQAGDVILVRIEEKPAADAEKALDV
ncbi:MAG: transglycosylase domain-containing protein, partial [Candidatus Binatia bacterium]